MIGVTSCGNGHVRIEGAFDLDSGTAVFVVTFAGQGLYAREEYTDFALAAKDYKAKAALLEGRTEVA